MTMLISINSRPIVLRGNMLDKRKPAWQEQQ